MFKKVLFAAVLGVVGVACAMPEAEDPYAGGRPDVDPSTKSAKVGECVSEVKGADPKIFPTCKGTKGKSGRCIPADKIGIFGDQFEDGGCASGMVCIPEQLVKDGTNIKLKKCTAGVAGEGRCFSSLAKEIGKNYEMLKGFTKDQCDGDLDVCAPCKNPLAGNAETGICFEAPKAGECAGGTGAKTGGGGPAAPLACPYTGPAIIDVKKMPAEDCGEGMRCVDSALLPNKSVADMLKKCAKGVCAPEKSIAAGGNYLPKSCRSLAGSEGRCTNVNIPQVASQKDSLPQDVCDPSERCTPCFNPIDGKETGACSTVSCDKPKEAAKGFAECCGGRAKCVPKTSVPDAQEANLEAQSCNKDTELCVPTELVKDANFKPQSCAGSIKLLGFISISNFNDGVCMSDCLKLPLEGAMQRSTCQSGEKCAPCKNPLTGAPTGAPGCAP